MVKLHDANQMDERNKIQINSNREEKQIKKKGERESGHNLRHTNPMSTSYEKFSSTRSSSSKRWSPVTVEFTDVNNNLLIFSFYCQVFTFQINVIPLMRNS